METIIFGYSTTAITTTITVTYAFGTICSFSNRLDDLSFFLSYMA